MTGPLSSESAVSDGTNAQQQLKRYRLIAQTQCLDRLRSSRKRLPKHALVTIDLLIA